MIRIRIVPEKLFLFQNRSVGIVMLIDFNPIELFTVNLIFIK